MLSKTFAAIARRHAWYRETVLRPRLERWSRERIDACQDAQELQAALALFKRHERHEARMQRHIDKALAALPSPSSARH